jgi:myo-inositol-1(or 4)-monophosphatase
MSETPLPDRGSPGHGLPDVELEQIAIEACRTAAARIRLSIDHRPIATKSTVTDIVTATDLAAEQAIRDILGRRAPGSMVLGEEGGHVAAGVGPHGDIEWVVDPLDGTVNFAYSLPVTAVSVAAVIAGRPRAAAVIDVGTGDEFAAHAGGGARCGGVPIAVSTLDSLALALVATGYSYDPVLRARHGRTVADLVGQVRDVRCFGSAALHLCWVAAGRLDAYVERDIKPWDHAGGALIATEAGALVELPCPENDNLVLAGNATMYRLVRDIITNF